MSDVLALEFLSDEEEYSGKSNEEIAKILVDKYGYVAVILFEDMGLQFACCRSKADVEEVNRTCGNKIVNVFHFT